MAVGESPSKHRTEQRKERPRPAPRQVPPVDDCRPRTPSPLMGEGFPHGQIQPSTYSIIFCRFPATGAQRVADESAREISKFPF